MKIAFFDTHRYDQESFDRQNAAHRHEITYFQERLKPDTAMLARGHEAICVFVNDQVNAAALHELQEAGVGLVALRCAGLNNVDLPVARELGLLVVRVPAYSPYAVAEHAVALMLGLNRHLCRANNRVRDGNFSLEGLVGFDMNGKTVGLVGTGKIGAVVARIMAGFGCRVLACDLHEDAALVAATGLRYAAMEEVIRESDILSLHVPLTPETKHVINADALGRMKPGVMLINTSRGALVDTRALLQSLKQGHIGAAGLDVYEEEGGVFFKDLSGEVLQDDVLARLLTFPNVLITSHQAFLTKEALKNIADTTLESIAAWGKGTPLAHLAG